MIPTIISANCPDGFAHGLCVFSERADVVYMTSAYYDPGLETGSSYAPEGGNCLAGGL
jgi:dTDP-4-dehydrorhamnose 3,5-epimerase-like enzyme